MFHINKGFKVLSIAFFSIFLLQSCSKSETLSSPASIPTDNFQVPATSDIVMYEINLNALSSTKNIQGVIDRLDAIKDMGVNTIWLMPIYPVGVTNSFGSPYCVRNYTAVNPSMGTLEDLKLLVTKAHEKNIAVLLDWVANHTSWDNVWMSNPSWYTHNTSGAIISPAGTNWNDVADLNFSNTEMRLAMIDAMKYWVINANIDGYRCDAADYVPFDFWQQALTSLNAIPNKHLILLAEGSRADHFNAGFQMNFSWDYMTALKNVFSSNQNTQTLFTSNSNENAAVPVGKRKLRFTTNHDESNIATPMSVFGSKNGALAASAITIFLQGVPLLYSGQEVGTTSYSNNATINWNNNPDMLLAYKNMLQFYNTSAASKTGILSTYPDPNICVFEKKLANESVVVMVNTRSIPKFYSIPPSLQGSYTDALTNTAVTLSSSISLAANKYLILKK